MARFNWDRTQSENIVASHGSESFTSDSLPSGYARGGSKFSPQIVKCPHCNNNFTVGLLPNHLFNCHALKRKRPKAKNEAQVIVKKVKANKPN